MYSLNHHLDTMGGTFGYTLPHGPLTPFSSTMIQFSTRTRTQLAHKHVRLDENICISFIINEIVEIKWWFGVSI